MLRGTAGRQRVLGLDGMHAGAQHAAAVRALLRVCQAVVLLRIHQQGVVTACAEMCHVKRSAWRLQSRIWGMWLGTVMMCATMGVQQARLQQMTNIAVSAKLHGGMMHA